MTAADGRRTWRSRWPLAAVVLVTMTGCSADEPVGPSFVGVPETVAIGGMPGPLSDTTVPTLPEVSVETTSTTTEPAPEPEPISGPLVDVVSDHRVLLIGDTALAATTPRAGGIMCDVVTGFGWDIAIEAEPGRSLEFADTVLDELLDEGWDVVGLMFGHHIAATVDDFELRLDELLDRLDQRPVVLVTVAELGEEQVEINRALRARERSRPNVVVLDWAEAAALEPETLLDGGGPAPSEEGAGRLALFVAALLSQVPGGEPGTCLEPVFTDDSAIVL